jgi:hypothetical protein
LYGGVPIPFQEIVLLGLAFDDGDHVVLGSAHRDLPSAAVKPGSTNQLGRRQVRTNEAVQSHVTFPADTVPSRRMSFGNPPRTLSQHGTGAQT